MSDSRAFVWCPDRLYTLYTFGVMLDRKEVRKKQKKKKKKKNEIEIFTFDFLDCEKKSWNFGAIFDIRIAKDFDL